MEMKCLFRKWQRPERIQTPGRIQTEEMEELRLDTGMANPFPTLGYSSGEIDAIGYLEYSNLKFPTESARL